MIVSVLFLNMVNENRKTNKNNFSQMLVWASKAQPGIEFRHIQRYTCLFPLLYKSCMCGLEIGKAECLGMATVK